jgi:hypothetical protein
MQRFGGSPRWRATLVAVILIVLVTGCGQTGEAGSSRAATSTATSPRKLDAEQAATEHRKAREAAANRRAADEERRRREEREGPARRWRELQRDLVSVLVLQGGAEAYDGISGEAESKGRVYAAEELQTLVESLSTARVELATLAEHSPQACASAIENARALLKQRQSIVEQTRLDSMGSEYGWANTAHELEPLELPLGHLGDGLQTCDPSGSGEVETEGSTNE